MLKKLQTWLAQQPFDALFIPHADEWQNEYQPNYNARLAAISNFTGSAGAAIITQNTAILFVDGRYTIQAAQQVSSNWDVVLISDQSVSAWAKQNLGGKTLAFDPWLVTANTIKQFDGIALHSLDHNPIDDFWEHRPAPQTKPFFLHDETFTGRSWQDKLTCLTQKPTLITDAASCNWLLNIRGRDVNYTPLALCRILITDTNITVYTNLDAVPDAFHQHFDGVTWKQTDDLLQDIAKLDTVYLDQATCPQAIINTCNNPILGKNPCLLPKACKTQTEQQGMRNCHMRDAQAVTALLDWLKTQENITEQDVSDKLLSLRSNLEHFVEPSFTTIAAAGANGAIVHYHPTPTSNAKLNNGDLFLLDSGGQYLDGTTDITRTVLIGGGTPSDEMIKAYTLVLKGHIMLAMAKFPKGTTGAQLDALARYYLWQEGLDYNHGTGHGVGSFLSVHEGPQGISKGYGNVPLMAGMVLSNEPGFYKEGHFGIRLENLVLVIENGDWLDFETLTKVRFEDNLIDRSLLDTKQLQWLDHYQKNVTKITA